MVANVMFCILFAATSTLVARAPAAFLRRMQQPPMRMPVAEEHIAPPAQPESATPEPTLLTIAPRKQVQFAQTTLKSTAAAQQAAFIQQTEQPAVQFKQVEGSNDGGEATIANKDLAAWYSNPYFYTPTGPRDIRATQDSAQESTPEAAAAARAATPQRAGSMGGGGGGGSGALMGSTGAQKPRDDKETAEREAREKQSAEDDQRNARQALIQQRRNKEIAAGQMPENSTSSTEAQPTQKTVKPLRTPQPATRRTRAAKTVD
jgi:hypothetical protein